MANTPITIPSSRGYATSADGMNLPYTGFLSRTSSKRVGTKTLDPATLEILIDIQMDRPSGVNPETVVLVPNGIKYGFSAPQAALHVVGRDFIAKVSWTLSRQRPIRFY